MQPKTPALELLVFPYRLGGIAGPWKPTLIFLPCAWCLLGLAVSLGVSLQALLGWTMAGLSFWTLLEYLFHRFGHLVYDAGRKRRWGPWVYGIHWVHHDHPEDPSHFTTRPPAVFFLSGIFFLIFYAVLPNLMAALCVEAGTLLGYLAYEWVHFRAHAGPVKFRPLLYLKQYHFRHHYGRENELYGVTSPIWDWVFRRRIFH